MKFFFSFLNGKERRANHRDTRRCGQGRLLDRASPLALPDARKPDLDSGIIGKTSPPIQDEPAPPVFALRLDVAKNYGESGSRTWITRNTKSFPTTPP
ncbi:hypothetical protein Hanom_Chr12g01152231 [Helianthus anomalus]